VLFSARERSGAVAEDVRAGHIAWRRRKATITGQPPNELLISIVFGGLATQPGEHREDIAVFSVLPR
jgi:hypothetical protein